MYAGDADRKLLRKNGSCGRHYAILGDHRGGPLPMDVQVHGPCLSPRVPGPAVRSAVRTTAFMLLLCALASCGKKSCDCPDNFPQMLVGVIPPPGFQGPEIKSLARLTVYFEDGSMFEFVDVPTGCPLQVMNILCTTPVFAGENDSSLDLEVESLSGAVAKEHVELLARDHCGSNVAYVAVTVDTDGALAITAPRYISPCP
jgi:hypothetical protein